jgi:hypothetical protein
MTRVGVTKERLYSEERAPINHIKGKGQQKSMEKQKDSREKQETICSSNLSSP